MREEVGRVGDAPVSIPVSTGCGRSITRSFQPMWGTLSRRSAGAMRTTSPPIQPKPGVSRYSSPRVAIICMPMQMPRKGRACTVTASSIASNSPVARESAARQAGKAPSPGRTMRSARTASSGREETRTRPAPVSAAIRWKAFSAEWRLPDS